MREPVIHYGNTQIPFLTCRLDTQWRSRDTIRYTRMGESTSAMHSTPDSIELL